MTHCVKSVCGSDCDCHIRNEAIYKRALEFAVAYWNDPKLWNYPVMFWVEKAIDDLGLRDKEQSPKEKVLKMIEDTCYCAAIPEPHRRADCDALPEVR